MRVLQVHSYSVIGNEAEPECYEIMVQLRDYAMIGENKLVGVGIVPLSEIVEKVSTRTNACIIKQSLQGSLSSWVQLGKRLQIDGQGLVLLRILSQRQQDELAKEFVKLKTETRYEEGAK